MADPTHASPRRFHFLPQHRSVAPILAFCALLLAYHWIFRSFYPLPSGLVGHDYSYVLPAFLDGYLWFRNNGLTPPWFTPSFCAGQPFFADPQSAFYSVPQFLAFVVDPLTAVYGAVLLFAAAGFWGMYFLARDTFKLSTAAAIVAATVFLFNGFHAHRMIVGHFGFHAFMLAPWLSWLLCRPLPPGAGRIGTALYTLGAGLILAYWLQAGLSTLIIPSGLAALALICLAQWRSGEALLSRALWRGAGASLVSLALCASKLTAIMTLMSRFPRTQYLLPGISDPLGLLNFVLHALFYSSEHAYRTANPLWQNMQWAALPHELAFGITFIPLVIMLAGALLALADRSAARRPREWPALALLVGIALVPPALLYYSPAWNALLKSLPLIGSTASPFRWLVILVPLLCMLTGIAANQKKLSRIAALACLIGIPTLNALEEREYYLSQNYNPLPVLRYERAVRSGAVEPKITHIATASNAAGQVLIDNTLFTQGYSPLFCYNPLFGYGLENYRLGHLQPGPATAEISPGILNLRNPACLLYPLENRCQPWDSFTVEQVTEARRFTEYLPFAFTVSPLQAASNLLTRLALLACTIALPLLLYLLCRKMGNPTARPSAPSPRNSN